VSVLERVAGRLYEGHLTEREFANVWVNGGAHPHLAGCAECRVRYDAFAASLAAVADDLRHEADAAFPAERLAAQQAQVLRRLEALERPVRIIAFPRAARPVIGGQSHVRRWITAAAAAGLIAGVGIGQLLEYRHTLTIDRNPVAITAGTHAAASTSRANGVLPVSATISDEDLLMGSDALARPRVPALGALDDLTPHARDLSPERPR
jgi:hypothetical protein